jgi:hypothetical protein
MALPQNSPEETKENHRGLFYKYSYPNFEWGIYLANSTLQSYRNINLLGNIEQTQYV